MAIEITDRQALHFGEHVVAHAFHGALRDERHDPAVSQRGDDAAGQKQTCERWRGAGRSCRISNADERRDVIVDEGAQKSELVAEAMALISTQTTTTASSAL